MNTFHPIAVGSVAILARAYAAGRPVRFWLNTSNEIVGTWLSKTGLTIGVGRCHSKGYRVCVFRACKPEDNFSRGGMVATAEAMHYYRAVEMAERTADVL